MSDPGKKNKRVQLQKRTMVNNEPVYYTEDVKTVWAEVVTINNREALLGGALSMPDTLRVMIWYRPFEAEEYRLSYGGVIYNIEDAIDVGCLHEDLQITCTKEPGAAPTIEKPVEGD